MSDRYSYARSRVAAKIAEFSIGTVTLTRSAPGGASPPYTPGPAVQTVYTLDARVDGASEYADGATILATDLVVIASPEARTAAGAVVTIVPQMSDFLHLDGAKKAVKKIEPVPATGDAALFRIFVGS